MGMSRNAVLAGFAILAGMPGFASTFTYTASGTAASDGRADNGEAVFTINAGTIKHRPFEHRGVGQSRWNQFRSGRHHIHAYRRQSYDLYRVKRERSGRRARLHQRSSYLHCRNSTHFPTFGWGLSGTAASLALDAGAGSFLSPRA